MSRILLTDCLCSADSQCLYFVLTQLRPVHLSYQLMSHPAQLLFIVSIGIELTGLRMPKIGYFGNKGIETVLKSDAKQLNILKNCIVQHRAAVVFECELERCSFRMCHFSFKLLLAELSSRQSSMK